MHQVNFKVTRLLLIPGDPPRGYASLDTRRPFRSLAPQPGLILPDTSQACPELVEGMRLVVEVLI